MSDFAVIEADHQFNRYIEALESLRLNLKITLPEFYAALLSTPLKDRPASLVEAARLLPPGELREFQRAVAFAFSKLRGD